MKIFFLQIVFLLLQPHAMIPDWGFYAHKKINRYAVFTLPQDMLCFYKRHIDQVTENAVNPDKRRYAIPSEATRHYIDIDHWDTIPFSNVPKDFSDALMAFGNVAAVTSKGDTTDILIGDIICDDTLMRDYVFDDRYANVIALPDAWKARLLSLSPIDSLHSEDVTAMVFRNNLAKYGTLPFFLEEYYRALVRAFEEKNTDAILHRSTDLGHYISDAHVPLHTTLNYDGQLTGQKGIHSFWESRLPELFAEEQYDFLVGKARYLDNCRKEIWSVIEESHRLVNKVLLTEKQLSRLYPEDRQHCYSIQSDYTVFKECPEYAAAWHEQLDGMVERRMREAIHMTGSLWYSAWVDAGQPDLCDI